MSSGPRIIGLDVLRALAIGGVVLSHGLVFLYPHVPALELGGIRLGLYHLGHSGYYGVELFFVLSGFLIGGLLLDIGPRLEHGRELARFYARRWFRTLPNYYLFLLVNLALIVWVFPQAVPWGRVGGYALFLQTFAQRKTFFFLESWSLCIEEWFYLLFPFGVWLVLRTGRKFGTAFLAVGISLYLGSTLGRLGYALNPANGWSEDLREIVLIRFDALMTGILAAWVCRRHPLAFARSPRAFALAGTALLIACYATLYWPDAQNQSLFDRTIRFNLVSLGFALLLPQAQRTLATRNRWFNASAGAIARWSYSMYLVHLPLHRLLRDRIFPMNQTSPLQGWASFAAFMVGTVAVSAAVYRWFERPTTRLRDRWT